MPFWKLANRTTKLTSLSISFGIDVDLPSDEEVEEQVEATFASLEVPVRPAPTTKEAREVLHRSIASRTIIAAARGGKLKHLYVESVVQYPFAIRALLPYWVSIENWLPTYGGRVSERAWRGAAASLRPLLAHVSLWPNATATSTRHDRALSLQEVQGLQSYFQVTGTPEITYSRDQPVDRYLPWLAQDAELAQQVADA